MVTMVINRDNGGDGALTLFFFSARASGIGAACRVGTCLPGPLGLSVFRLGGSLSRGGAGVPLASHEGEHAERKERKDGKAHG